MAKEYLLLQRGGKKETTTNKQTKNPYLSESLINVPNNWTNGEQ